MPAHFLRFQWHDQGCSLGQQFLASKTAKPFGLLIFRMSSLANAAQQPALTMNADEQTSQLLDIGDQCTFADCHKHDFLPIACPHCLSKFCSSHIIPDVHACPAIPNVNPEEGRVGVARERCVFSGCSNPSMESAIVDKGAENRVPALCPRCGLAFCITFEHCFCYVNRSLHL